MNIGLMFSFRNPPKWKKPWADVYADQLDVEDCSDLLAAVPH